MYGSAPCWEVGNASDWRRLRSTVVGAFAKQREARFGKWFPRHGTKLYRRTWLRIEEPKCKDEDVEWQKKIQCGGRNEELLFSQKNRKEERKTEKGLRHRETHQLVSLLTILPLIS